MGLDVRLDCGERGECVCQCSLMSGCSWLELICSMNSTHMFAHCPNANKTTKKTILLREHIVAGAHQRTSSVTSPCLSRSKTGGTNTHTFAEPLGRRDVALMFARLRSG